MLIGHDCGTFLLRFSETDIEQSQKSDICGCLSLAFVETNPDTGRFLCCFIALELDWKMNILKYFSYYDLNCFKTKYIKFELVFGSSIVLFTVIHFRLTPPSRPNEVGLKCPSARPSVRPQYVSSLSMKFSM